MSNEKDFACEGNNKKMKRLFSEWEKIFSKIYLRC